MYEKSRAWTFTLDNYDEKSEVAIALAGAKYTIYGKEIGEQGTPCLEGYMYFASAIALRSLKKKLPGAQWEVRRCTHEQTRDHCRKDGDYVEYGNPPMFSRTKRNRKQRDYEEAFELAKEGRLADIPEPLRTRFFTTYEEIRDDYQTAPPVWSLSETSGTGRTPEPESQERSDKETTPL